MSTNNNEFLLKIIELEESHNLDFKEDPSGESFEKALIAFANTEGGQFYVGITDKRPRNIKGTTFEAVENFVSGVLKETTPRPFVDYKKYNYIEGTETRTVICVEIHRSDILVQFKGIFPYRALNSSSNSRLNLDQIKARLFQNTLAREQFKAWINSFSTDKNEYVYFCLSPPSLQPEVFDFLFQREIDRDMISTEDGSGVTVSFDNPRFHHPILNLLEKWQVFRNQDGYTTRDYHTIHEERTGNILRIFREGTVYGRIMYNVLFPGMPPTNFYLENLFANSSLFSNVSSDNRLFPYFKIGSLKRSLALILHLLTNGEFPWKKANYNAFNLKIVIPLIPNSILIDQENVFHFNRRTFLGIEPFILFEREITLDIIKIRTELQGRPNDAAAIYEAEIKHTLDFMDNELKTQILSYFGSPTRIAFMGSRTNVHLATQSQEEILRVYTEELLKEFRTFPIIDCLYPANSSIIPKEGLKLVDIKDKRRDLSIAIYEVQDPLHLPDPLQRWYSEKVTLGKKPLFFGFECTLDALPGYFWDEWIENGTVMFAEGILRSVCNVLLSRIFDNNIEDDFPNISIENIPSLKQQIQETKSNRDYLSFKDSDGKKICEFKTEEDINKFLKILTPIGSFSAKQIGIVSGETLS